MSWALVLHLHSMEPIEAEQRNMQVIEIKGFSTKSDCEKAGEAAGKITLAKEGPLNGLIIECKRENPGIPG
ncbi:hypothetical protein JHC42_04240 [Pseudomonas sp. OA3]|nr:hypothetical protein [Pseudomonas sp. OA3]